MLRRTRTTLSPLKNILDTKRSLLTGFFPFPFGASVHISLTFSSTCTMNLVSRSAGLRDGRIDHIRMSIERLAPREKFAVIPERDENLGVSSHGSLENGKWTVARRGMSQFPLS